MEPPTYYFHYWLIDPRDHAVFYIGCTKNPNRRYRRHLRCIENNQAKNERIQAILATGYYPLMEIRDTSISRETAYKWEAHQIRTNKQYNPALTNILSTKEIEEEDEEEDE